MRLGPLGLPEILIILVVLLLVFGSRRLPEIASSMGKGIRSFKLSVTGEEEPENPVTPTTDERQPINSDRNSDDRA